MLKGCDVSNWQTALPRGYEYYIIKATEGVGFIDARMKTHTENAKKQTNLIGFYHFARPDLGNSPIKEADYFVSVIKNYIGRAVLALDLECSNYQNYATWAKQWLDRVFEKTGVRPLLYVPGYYAQNFKDVVRECNSGVWAPSSESYYNGMTIVIKQTVQNNLDVDYFYGNEAAWKKYAASTRSKTIKKTNAEIAKEVITGKWGNGETRKQKLTAAGYDYSAIQKIINEKYSTKKSNEEIAKEVITGKWGNGQDRKNKLKEAGYDYSAIQKIVNKLL